jgi:hypothetical protein
MQHALGEITHCEGPSSYAISLVPSLFEAQRAWNTTAGRLLVAL